MCVSIAYSVNIFSIIKLHAQLLQLDLKNYSACWSDMVSGHQNYMYVLSTDEMLSLIISRYSEKEFTG